MYVYIEREFGPDIAVSYFTREEAERAANESPLIDSLCEEDCLDAYVVDNPLEAEVIVEDEEEVKKWYW